jgi:hypothetical protein
MSELPPPKRPLDYVTPRRRRQLVHPVYLAVTLSCFALAVAAYVFAARKLDEPWFLVGCCGVPLFAFLGFLFLYGTIAAPRRKNEEEATKPPSGMTDLNDDRR